MNLTIFVNRNVATIRRLTHYQFGGLHLFGVLGMFAVICCLCAIIDVGMQTIATYLCFAAVVLMAALALISYSWTLSSDASEHARNKRMYASNFLSLLFLHFLFGTMATLVGKTEYLGFGPNPFDVPLMCFGTFTGLVAICWKRSLGE